MLEAYKPFEVVFNFLFAYNANNCTWSKTSFVLPCIALMISSWHRHLDSATIDFHKFSKAFGQKFFFIYSSQECLRWVCTTLAKLLELWLKDDIGFCLATTCQHLLKKNTYTKTPDILYFLVFLLYDLAHSVTNSCSVRHIKYSYLITVSTEIN